MKRFFSVIPSALKYERPIKYSHTGNGIRTVCESWDSDLCTLGVMIQCGSCDELSKQGTANVLAKLLLSGTKTRSAASLKQEFQELNASLEISVRRDNTWIQVKAPSFHSKKVIELLGDMISDTLLNENSIEAAKKLAIRECEEAMSVPSYALFENVHRIAFKNHPLANFVRGNPSSIGSILRNDLVKFSSALYSGNKIIVSGAGGVDSSFITEWTNQYFGKLHREGIQRENPEVNYEPSSIICESEEEELTYITVGFPAPSLVQSEFLEFQILRHMLQTTEGSTVKQELEKVGGLVSHSCLLASYQQAGLLLHFLVAEPSFAPLLARTLIHLTHGFTSKVTPNDLQAAKNSFYADLINIEASAEVAQNNANQLRLFNSRISRAYPAIRAVSLSSEKLPKTYSEWFKDSMPVVGIYGQVTSKDILEIIYS